MVTRRDLRAERDFYSPMTGDKSSTYGSQVRSRLEDLKNVKSTRAPAIEAAFVKLLKTEDPFTKIDEKKSYAPEEENDFMGALEGLGDSAGSDVVERVEEFVKPLTGGGGGGNRPNVVSRNPNDRISRMSTSQLVNRDNKRYGNTFPDGSFNITKKPDGDQPTKTEETRTYYGQGGLPLGTTTIRQGGEVKDGKYVGPQEKGPAINASGFQQKNVRGSAFNTGKDESARPKTVTIGGQTVAARQTVASLPSNYKATEAKAFAAAKNYKAAAAVANRNPNVSISRTTGKAEATNNTARARAQAAAVNRKMSGTSMSQAKAANRASMKAAAAARHSQFKKDNSQWRISTRNNSYQSFPYFPF